MSAPAGSPTVQVGRDGPVVTVRLARPEARNAMSTRMGGELLDALGALGDAGAVVVTGDATAFSAGADVKEGPGMTPGRARVWGQVLDRLWHLDVPVVAAIEGWCLGGGLELALACHVRVAGSAAQLGTPEVRHGVFPAGGGTQRLARLVGPGRALRLMLLGTPVDAATALAWGLVDELTTEGGALEQASRWAAVIAGFDRAAVREILYLVRKAWSVPLSEGLALERARLAHLLDPDPTRAGARGPAGGDATP